MPTTCLHCQLHTAQDINCPRGPISFSTTRCSCWTQDATHVETVQKKTHDTSPPSTHQRWHEAEVSWMNTKNSFLSKESLLPWRGNVEWARPWSPKNRKDRGLQKESTWEMEWQAALEAQWETGLAIWTEQFNFYSPLAPLHLSFLLNT